MALINMGLHHVTLKQLTEGTMENRLADKRKLIVGEGDILFEELFKLEEIQKLQDEFSSATGVASIITKPDGTPITKPSHFCTLCINIIRKTKKGLINCHASDAALGSLKGDGPRIQPCMSGGLWDAGTSISVGGRHIANWLIGQVRDETQTEGQILAYAREIDADEQEVLEAFRQVPAMSLEQFEKIAQCLHTLAKQLSVTAYKNVQRERLITERKQAEVELRKSEEKYRTLVESLEEGICNVDENETFLFANQAVADIFGFTKSEMIGKNLKDLTTPESYQQVLHETSVRKTGKSNKYELDILRKNGEKRIITVTATPVLSSNKDEFQGTFGIFHDITERKISEEALARTTALLNSTSEIAKIGGWELDLSSMTLIWSLGTYKLHEVDPGTPVNLENAIGFYAPEAQPVISAAVQAAIESGTPFDLELPLITASGRTFWARAQGSAMTQNGKVVRIVGVFQDITERKQSEKDKEKLKAQLTQAQKMESIGRLAGGVAHDFNNMTGVVLGHTEMLLEHMDPSQPIYADLEEIRKAARRSADLTRQLLAFARQQTVSPKVLDLNQTIENMLRMIQRLIGENIDLVWLPGQDLKQIKMDPSQLDQMLANLCINARDAIKDMGQITIETRNITIDADYCLDHAGFVPGEFVLLSVSDSGCGMDQETLARAFEPFFTTKELGKGTGLGLATVYGIIKQNRGFINMYSEPGKGTSFALYFPRYLGKPLPLREKSAIEPDVRGNETILVVEDEAPILKMTQTMLQRLGYKVLAAKSPGEAISLAKANPEPIHLLITDVIMPEMNGRDLATKLLSLYPDLPRLFMSGYTANVIAHQGILDEGVHFIQKPFTKKDLAIKVREALKA